ncbi:MAG: hypothetical protein MnENMB40S_14700 [Rhizobiaceae bacterium MnEN-MB40S]|nr:MAG: hypothetical protein MnENMB40S_14700 [Rhizobiaceae bacterium MnEN-MB40S]
MAADYILKGIKPIGGLKLPAAPRLPDHTVHGRSIGKRVLSLLLDKLVVGDEDLIDPSREQVRVFCDFENEGASENVRAWLRGLLVFSNVTLLKQSISHHSGDLEKSIYLSLQVYRRGLCRDYCHDVSFEMLPGQVHIFDF